MVSTEFVKISLEFGGGRIVHGLEVPVEARYRTHAVGRCGQVRRGLGVDFSAALQ